jgi:hypothetical protein
MHPSERRRTPLPSLALAVSLLAAPAAAQWTGLTLPPDGDNQKASVRQDIGLVRVTVDYSSPDVHGADGEDRTGKIWGQLVAYGPTDLGFGTCAPDCPWRGGANENTVFTVSHDIEVQGQPLPAGSYGLHFYPGPEEWTVIFSRNSTSWGSFTYDAGEDALRVKAKPRPGPYTEWLTYEFTDRRPDRATLALRWEKLELPIEITVDDPTGLWVENMRRQLRTWPGFNWQNYETAARWCVENKTNLPEALRWAGQATDPARGGQESFRTLATLAEAEAANGKAAEARSTLDRALAHPAAGVIEIHLYGRQLQARGRNDEALRVFEANARRHPGVWPTALGLARGHAALGHGDEARKHAREALPQAPDDAARRGVEAFLQQLEADRGKG